MLCKKCERVIPDNQSVCLYCGTSAVDVMSEKLNDNNYINKKRNRKKNKKNNITNINNMIESETPILTDKKTLQESKPEISAPQNTPEIPVIPTEQPQQTTLPSQTPEISSPSVEQPQNTPTGNISYTETVTKNSDLPVPDNKHTLPDTSGIIYEIAEELYLREKTEAEIEALCQPPFKKVFSEKQLRQLDEQAREKAKIMVSSAITESTQLSDKSEIPQTVSDNTKSDDKHSKSISTAKAFLLQLILLIPLANIIFAFAFSFGKTSNNNIKAYSRAFLIWSLILIILSCILIAFMYFSNPTTKLPNIDLNNLLKLQ